MKIELDERVYAQYILYAKVRHISPNRAITYALQDWMESVGMGHLQDAAAHAGSQPFFDELTKIIAPSVEP